MKKKIQTVAALITVLMWSDGVLADNASVITSVVLYPGSATIERTAHVRAGADRLELTGLPANFDPQTVRAEADPGIQIGEVSVHDVGRAQAIGGYEAEIEAKIQALTDQKSVLDVDAKSAELVRDFLVRLGGAPVDKSNNPQPLTIDPKSLSIAIEIMSHAGHDAFALLQRVEVRKRELDKQIKALQRDLARVRSDAKDVRTIAVNLVANSAGDIRVSYEVRNAGWRPTYRAALDSASSIVELERQAVVSQTTGEDWTGVTVKLSTSQPRQSPQGPIPYPWTLSVRPPRGAPVAPSVTKGAPSSSEAMRSWVAGGASPFAVSELQSTFATEFEVPGQVDLPSDGRQLTVSLSKQVIAVTQHVRVVPRLATAAFVTAEAERPEGVWLPGNIQLYRDGNLVGSTQWNSQSSDKLMFPFGRDDRFRVTVDRVRDRSGDSGFFANRAEREVGYTFTLTNLHKAAVEALILDSSPVSTSDQIEVKATFEPKPTAENWENKQGVVAWEKSIRPGATLKVNVAYAISYPKEISVIGLP